jgi:hypothetical protein
MVKTLEVKMQFEEVSFAHIYRKFNSNADHLSKEAILLQEGFLAEQEFRENVLFAESGKSLF